MGVENYVATLALSPVTETDATFVEWSAEFDAAPEREDQLSRTSSATCSRPGSPP